MPTEELAPSSVCVDLYWLGTGGMRNFNSLTSWLLARSDHDLARLGPPVNGRAPGWAAGVLVAGRSMRDVSQYT